ncbi:uncharacterized protein SCHCODRAFT_02509664 [Schizophyllum commune H4-8]|uniref:Expressed protein n=1 Tax=Schizophyllum commune (strain H4-8 / FGSC 9210) TaxID=578458 RepID=D8QBP7_SCHCM|nr:uncharacterized protein SCHCODRAFT_02509664 [Schizophyllum commune H4-8]KAI5889261.1 hypothetical protein SCHCODRAFT_02509664 [Schizophyllum commune H4-8]
MATIAPPPYSPAAAAPAYTPAARPEERVICARLRATNRLPTGHFVRQYGSLSIVVYDQEEGVSTPTFGRRAVIRGYISLSSSLRCKVEEVVLKVEGRLELAYAGGGSSFVRTLDDSYTIWSSTCGCVCPGELPFTSPLPSNYVSADGRTHTLPPSFRSIHHGVPALFVRSYYRVRVYVYKKRHGPFGLIAGTERLMMPFEYCPRTRPSAPFFPLECFFSTIKHLPEEWTQIAMQVNPMDSSGLSALQCYLFVPAVRVFGICDKIPVHLLLAGSVESLRAFVPSADDSTTTPPPKGKGACQCTADTIRLSLIREVMMEVRGNRLTRSEPIGDGHLWPVPPSARSCECSTRAGDAEWEGELSCRKEVTVGSFAVGGLWVQDYIHLELQPLRPGMMRPSRHRVPIKLTTDPFAEPEDPVTDGVLSSPSG